MKLIEMDIAGVIKVVPDFIADDRGQFFRYYCKNEFSAVSANEFVQMNHSINTHKGTLRGMHYQLPPNAEEKLVRCVKGSIYDVFVDLRKNSPTFLEWGSAELSAKNYEMLFLPKGIAHGFITLEDDSHVLYMHTEFYSPESERGLHYGDAKIGIKWPIPVAEISDRDRNHQVLSELFNGIEL